MTVITLHEIDGVEITVFVENICTLKETKNGTCVSMASGKTDLVRETKDQIIATIRINSINLKITH